jgi:hypothetical protein
MRSVRVGLGQNALLGCVTLLSLIFLASSASAGKLEELVTTTFVDLEWAGTGGSNTIGASPGDQLTLEIYVQDADLGITSYGVSIAFDTDLMDELDLVGDPTELCPLGSCLTTGVDSTQESTFGSQVGFVYTFESVTFGAGSFDRMLVGTIDFEVTENVASDGWDVFSGEFNTGIDAFFDAQGQPLSPEFGYAQVPEPGTALLLGIGLASLAVSSRKRA